MNKIHVNIWDDFHSDGYVPAGETQETYIYIEESDFSEEQKKTLLEKLLPIIQNLFSKTPTQCFIKKYDTKEKYPHMNDGDCHGAWRHWSRWEIRLNPIAHADLESVMELIEHSPITIDGVELKVYSES